MGTRLPRGFKSDARRLADEIRDDLGLDPLARLDPRVLADEYGIPVLSIADLGQFGATETAIRQLTEVDSGCFSALTVFSGTRRLIVENQRHSDGRRSNSVAHEMSHVLLEHVPLDHFASGCRKWDGLMEKQADILAGDLLVTRRAAFQACKSGDFLGWARRLGVSVPLLKWRANMMGVPQQLRRGNRRYRGR